MLGYIRAIAESEKEIHATVGLLGSVHNLILKVKIWA